MLVTILIALWSWFAQFLAPALGQPIVSINELARPNVSLWILLPLIVACAGWGLAYSLHIKPRPSWLAQSKWGKTLYVLFLNKGYCDEIYEVSIVQPTLRLSKWLWLKIDLGGIDRFINNIARISVTFSRWLWHIVDSKGIDQGVVGIGDQTVSFARGLWKFCDIQRIEENVKRLGQKSDATSQTLQRIEPQTLQHHLLGIIIWLVATIGLFYWLV
jgi:NADH:ubiquinone oxidoreductase subunit 5 (subunit L)/multisubunit Na+/H+ antiporter MnhA subunit